MDMESVVRGDDLESQNLDDEHFNGSIQDTAVDGTGEDVDGDFDGDNENDIDVVDVTEDDDRPDKEFDVEVNSEGIVKIPKLGVGEEMKVNELENMANAKNRIDMLWMLAVGVARMSVELANPKGTGNTERNRCFQLVTHLDLTIKSFPLTTEGRHILHFFLEKKTNCWPGAMQNMYDKTLEDCMKGLTKWYKTSSSCILSDVECKDALAGRILDSTKVNHAEIYMGKKLYDLLKKAEVVCNQELNNHWPDKLRIQSGETPLGLLQVIRKWYWESVESLRRATNAEKQAESKKLKAAKDTVAKTKKRTAGEDAERLQRIQQRHQVLKKHFRYGWYPNFWLLWLCYGVPNGGGDAVIASNCKMHTYLVKVSSYARAKQAITRQEQEIHDSSLPNKSDRQAAYAKNGTRPRNSSSSSSTSSTSMSSLNSAFANQALTVTIRHAEAPKGEPTRLEAINMSYLTLTERYHHLTEVIGLPKTDPTVVQIAVDIDKYLVKRTNYYTDIADREGI